MILCMFFGGSIVSAEAQRERERERNRERKRDRERDRGIQSYRDRDHLAVALICFTWFDVACSLDRGTSVMIYPCK